MVNRLLQSSFVKFTSIVFVGNVASQLVVFLAFALFARYFPKEEIGVYTIFISISIILSIVATGRYELAIMLPKKDKEASHLFVGAISLAALFSLIVFAVLFFIPIQHFFDSVERLKKYLLFLPLGVFFMSAYQSCILFNNRLESYKTNAVMRVMQAVLMLLGSFFIAQQFGYTAWSLILAWVFSQAIVFLINNVFFLKFYKTFSFYKLKQQLNDYKRYPTIALAGNFINSLSTEMPNYIIPAYFGLATQTLYAYGNKVAAAPRNFIAAAVGEVFYKSSSKISHESPQQLLAHLFKVTKVLFLFSIGMYGITVLVSSYVFPLIFGVEYAEAAYYFNWIALASIFMFVQQPISTIDDVVHKLTPTLYYNIFALCLKSSALLLAAIYLKNPLYALAVYCITNAVLTLFWIAYLHKMAKDFSEKNTNS